MENNSLSLFKFLEATPSSWKVGVYFVTSLIIYFHLIFYIYCRRSIVKCRSCDRQLFQESQIRTRNPIERSYGVWKRRLPCLAMGLQLKLDRVQAVIQ